MRQTLPQLPHGGTDQNDLHRWDWRKAKPILAANCAKERELDKRKWGRSVNLESFQMAKTSQQPDSINHYSDSPNQICANPFISVIRGKVSPI
jgi:hypothetical protein